MAVTDHYDLWYLDPDEELSDFPSMWDINIDTIDDAIHAAATDTVELSRIPNLPAGKTTSGRFADARIPTTVARTSETSALESRIAELESGPRSTGARDVTSMSAIDDITAGQFVVWRVGETVTLSINQIVLGEGAGEWTRVLGLPAGFKPVFDCRENLLSAKNGHQLTLYKSGSLYLNKRSDYSYRNTISFATDETWPSSLPGEPA